MQKKTGGVGVLAQPRLSFAHCEVWDRLPTGACLFVLCDNSEKVKLIVFVTTHCPHVSKVIAAAYKEGTAHEVS